MTTTDKTESPVLAWHFLCADRRLQYGSRELIEVGSKIVVAGPPVLCRHGLHASVRAIDALNYAPGNIACRVVVGGDVKYDTDKLVGTERTVIAMADAEMLLHTFACDVAEKALKEHGGDNVDPRSWRAIEVKRLWIQGKASDSELDAAWAAAWDAARDAARAAAWDAARDAARAAAWAAAWDAAWDAQNAALEDMLFDLMGIGAETTEVPA